MSHALVLGWPKDECIPLLILSTVSATITLTQVTGESVRLEHTAYTLSHTLLQTETKYVLTFKTISEKQVYEVYAPNIVDWEGIIVRSCDNAGLTFRNRSVEKLKALKPKGVITLGDMIYADIYRPTFSGTPYETYYQVWCQALHELIPITTHSATLFIADDHEINDNVDFDHMTSDEKVGFILLHDIYQKLVGHFRTPTNDVSPYDNYTFSLDGTQVLMLGHKDVNFVKKVLAETDQPLMVFSNKPGIMTKSAWMTRLYYTCVGGYMPVDACPTLFNLLASHPKPVRFIAGDYHRLLTGNYKGVEIRVTSPFSGVQFWGEEEYFPAITQKSKSSNFYCVKQDKHVIIETSECELYWNSLVTMQYRICGCSL